MIRPAILAALLAQAQLSQAQVAPSALASDDLASAARAAFASKCVQCHGPDVPHPKASFGYVTDLRRLVASGKYAVPGKPEESEIWKQISGGDMPPDEAKAGPLSPAERDAILAWIVAGAPEGTPPASTIKSAGDPQAPAAPDAPRDAAPPRDDSSLHRLITLIGRFHVVVIHFPIAMLVTAALAELRAFAQRSHVPPPAVRFCLWIGAISAIAAAALGWIHALDGFPGPLADPLSLANLHRWLGTAAAALAPLVALAAERDARNRSRTPLTRTAILLLAGAVAAAAHFGGLLTHGAGFLSP